MRTRAGARHRAARWTGLACLLLVAGGMWVCWDSLVEGWCRIQLRHSTGTAAYRAAARLTRGTRQSSILVRDWALETATRLALDPIPDGDPGRANMRDEILGALAEIHLWRGEVNVAEALSAPIRFQLWRRVSPETIRAGKHRRPDRRAEKMLVADVAASGDVLGSLRLAGAADERSSRFDGLGDVIEGLRESVGTPRVIAETAARIDPCGEDGWAVHALAVLQGRLGDLEGAYLTALRSERLGYARHEGVPHVVELLAAAGEERKASSLVDLYVEKSDRAVVLARAARGFAEGDRRATARRALDAAMRIIEELPDEEYPRAVSLMEAGRAWWKLGDTLESRKCYRHAALLTNWKNRHLVTKAQAEEGDCEGALETAARRCSDLQQIARIEARLGRFEAALSIAEKAEQPGTFALIGAEQRTRGDLAGAYPSFRRAFDVAAEIPTHVGGSPSRVNAYRTCAREEGRSGSSESTIRATLAESIPLFRAALLLGMAEGIEERLAGR